MQELCGTRRVAASIAPHLVSTVDEGLVEQLHCASLIYVAFQGLDLLTWVSVLCLPLSSSVPLVHVLGPKHVCVTGEIGRDDPLHQVLQRKPNAMIGLTVMQEWTRDRFRLMGHLTPTPVAASSPPPSPSLLTGVSVVRFTLVTSLVMGLCPKYIVDRRIVSRRTRTADSEAVVAVESRSCTSPLPLPEAALQMIRKTDTFWLGTTEVGWGCQSSHRGGLPGFVRLSPQLRSPLPRLVWADYKGNSMFHSLGSALHNPLAAVLMLDYEEGHCLQLAGKLETVFAQEPGTDLDGASRHVQLTVEQWRYTPRVVPFRFRTASYSYHSPVVREARGAAPTPRSAARVSSAQQLPELELTAIVGESVGVATFRLTAPTGAAPLPPWLPGQYATLRLDIDGVEVERSWTITSLSSTTTTPLRPQAMDVTVKLADGGLVSSFLHQRAASGLRLRLVGVEGGFGLPSMYWTESAEGVSVVHGRPLRKLWLSAGIGITPFLAHMRCLLRFHQLHERAGVSVPPTDILWLHVDRALERIPCLDEIAAMVKWSSTLTSASGAAPPFTLHLVLCLTLRSAERELQDTAGEGGRAASLFGDQLLEDAMGHMPLVQVKAGRPTATTLLHACRCPPLAPQHAPPRCDDSVTCRRLVLVDDRGVDACGSPPVVQLFKAWCGDWKDMGITVRNFRTESFAY